MVDMISDNPIVMCATLSVSPRPTDRDARVIKFGHFVIFNRDIVHVTDPDRHGSWTEPSTFRDQIASHDDSVPFKHWRNILRDRHCNIRCTNLQSPRPEISHLAIFDPNSKTG